MTVSDSMPKMKLKIKFSSKKIAVVEQRSEVCDISQQLWVNDKTAYPVSPNGTNKSAMKISHKVVHQYLDNPKVYDAADSLKVRSSGHCSSKRRLTVMTDFQEQKRRRMDCSVKRQCGSILKSLINHPNSYGFTEPVDPVALNIPDYFLVIKEPMDLGTIQTKLEDDMYFSADEFAADVRLTFSNAMKYNPPSNSYHVVAKRLVTFFNTRWKPLEAKLKRERINVEGSLISSCSERKIQGTIDICPRYSHVPFGSLSGSTMSTDEKRELIKELLAAMRGKMSNELWMLLKELDLSLQKLEKGEIKLDGFEDATLLKLKKLAKGSLNARGSKVNDFLQ